MTARVVNVGPAFSLAASKAMHEAGHALAAVEGGFIVHAVSIVPSELGPRSGGGMLMDAEGLPRGNATTQRERVALAKAMHVALAGPVAEALFKSDSLAPSPVAAREVDMLNLLIGCTSDLLEAAGHARAAGLDIASGNTGELRDCYARLMTWLASNRATLRAVAHALATRARLTGDEVAGIMASNGCSPLYDREGRPFPVTFGDRRLAS